MKKILYFIAGAVPTKVDLEKADALSTKDTRVLFRNASFVTESDSIEANDGVAGAVPKVYTLAKGAVIADENINEEDEGDESKPPRQFGPKA